MILHSIYKTWSNLSQKKQINLIFIPFLSFCIFITLSFSIFFSKKSLEKQAFSLLSVNQSRVLKYINLKHITDLNEILLDHKGLGESGETYILDSFGNLLSHSRFTPSPSRAPIPAFFNHWEGIKKDYRGIEVLAVWDRIDGTNNILASEIDLSEVLSPLKKLTLFSIYLFSAIIIILFLLSPLFSKLLNLNIEQLKAQNLAAFDGQEKERTRISMELHDHLGVRLTSLSYLIASSTMNVDLQKNLLNELQEINSNIREISLETSNHILNHHGLKEACEEWFLYFQKIALKKNIHFNSQIITSNEEYEIKDVAYSISIYRVIQESLNNILKHSNAKTASCIMDFSRKPIKITIKDDGSGFHQNQQSFSPLKMGQKNMISRIEAIGGKIKIISNKNEGTQIEVIV